MKIADYKNRPPEFDFFSKLNYDLMLTVSPRNSNRFGNRKSFISEHDRFAMRIFRKLCKNSKTNRLYYFGRSEFGADDRAHLHLLFTLDKCRNHEIYSTVKPNLHTYLHLTLKELIQFPDFLDGVFDLHCTMTGNSKKDSASLVNYLCKEGYSSFRDDGDQNFVYPKAQTDEAFVDAVRKRKPVESGSQEIADKVVWMAKVSKTKWIDRLPVKTPSFFGGASNN
jgi:hypothetical protein